METLLVIHRAIMSIHWVILVCGLILGLVAYWALQRWFKWRILSILKIPVDPALAASSARNIFEKYKTLYTSPLDFAETTIAAYPDLDPPWFYSVAARAGTLGFQPLGFFHCPGVAEQNKNTRMVNMVFTAPDHRAKLTVGTHRKALSDTEQLFYKTAGRPEFTRTWQLQTEFSDRTAVATTDNPIARAIPVPPGSVCHVDEGCADWTAGIAIHRTLVEQHLAEIGGRKVVEIGDKAAFLASEAATFGESCERRRAMGYVTPEMVRELGKCSLTPAFFDQIAVALEAVLAEERAKGTIPPAPADVPPTTEPGISA